MVNPVVLDSIPLYNKLYVHKDYLYATEYYMDTIEDMDNLVRTLAEKAKSTFPKKDKAFGNRISWVRKCIRCQKKVLHLLKEENNRKFPNKNIIDSKDKESEYLVALCSKVKDGPEIIAARPVAIVAIIVYNKHLKDINDPTPQDYTAAKVAQKIAANALWHSQ